MSGRAACPGKKESKKQVKTSKRGRKTMAATGMSSVRPSAVCSRETKHRKKKTKKPRLVHHPSTHQVEKNAVRPLFCCRLLLYHVMPRWLSLSLSLSAQKADLSSPACPCRGRRAQETKKEADQNNAWNSTSGAERRGAGSALMRLVTVEPGPWVVGGLCRWHGVVGARVVRWLCGWDGGAGPRIVRGLCRRHGVAGP